MFYTVQYKQHRECSSWPRTAQSCDEGQETGAELCGKDQQQPLHILV